MWTHERHSLILEHLSRDKKVETNRLADVLDVSRETIRRDLLELGQQGSLLRVRGGAVLTGKTMLPEPAFSDRLSAYAHIKERIGRAAVDLIAPGSTVFVDAGTTTLAFARALPTSSDLRIITNSIEIARLLAGHTDVLLLGGQPNGDVPATFGELTLSEIDRFLADYAVISPVAVDLTRGATNYELHEAEVARKMIRCSRKNILLCDSSKVGKESRVAVCRTEEIDAMVTDSQSDPAFALPSGDMHHVDADGT